jgi:hypothetical protein
MFTNNGHKPGLRFHGASSLHYAHRHGTLTLITEAPMWQEAHPDQGQHPPYLHILPTMAAGLRRDIDELDAALRRVTPEIRTSSVFYRAIADAIIIGRVYIKRWEKAAADLPHGAHINGTHVNGARINGTHVNGTHVNGTHVVGAQDNATHANGAQVSGAAALSLAAAELAGAKLTSWRIPLRASAMLRRLLRVECESGNHRPVLRAELIAAEERFARGCARALEGAFQPVPLRDLVGLQLSAALTTITHLRNE